jgi:hypothetical protein
MVNSLEDLTEVEEVDTKIPLPDNRIAPVVATGIRHIVALSDTGNPVISEIPVVVVPSLEENLFSLTIFAAQGGKITIDGSKRFLLLNESRIPIEEVGEHFYWQTQSPIKITPMHAHKPIKPSSDGQQDPILRKRCVRQAKIRGRHPDKTLRQGQKRQDKVLRQGHKHRNKTTRQPLKNPLSRNTKPDPKSSTMRSSKTYRWVRKDSGGRSTPTSAHGSLETASNASTKSIESAVQWGRQVLITSPAIQDPIQDQIDRPRHPSGDDEPADVSAESQPVQRANVDNQLGSHKASFEREKLLQEIDEIIHDTKCIEREYPNFIGHFFSN